MKLWIFILQFFAVYSKNLLNEFITKNFANQTITILSSNLKMVSLEFNSIYFLKQPKLILNPKISVTINLDYIENFIFIEKYLNRLLLSIKLTQNKINTRGRFLVILQKHISKNEVKTVFEFFWSFYIYNIVIFSNGTDFYTWYPYKSVNKCGTFINLEQSLEPYEHKIPKYFDNCFINITWCSMGYPLENPQNKVNPGYSIKLLNTISKKLKLKPIYLTENINYFVLHYQKGNYEDLRQDMIKRKIDLALAYDEREDLQYKDLEFGIQFLDINEYFVLPSRKPIISSIHILIIFPVQVWLLIVISVLLLTLLWKHVMKKSVSSSFFQIVQLILAISTTNNSKSYFQKLTFLLVIFYFLNLNLIYLSQLSGVLSKPTLEPKITTVQELSENTIIKVKIRKGKTYKKLSNLIKYKNILDKSVIVRTDIPTVAYIKETVSQENFGVILTEDILHSIRNYQELQIIYKEKIKTTFTCIVFRKGFPLLDHFNSVTQRIIETGIVKKWRSDSNLFAKKGNVLIIKTARKTLYLERIVAAFTVWGIGIFISLLIFIYETIKNRLI